MASFHDLFSHNMDEVLQEVFLLLSPGCLHRARQVTFDSWQLTEISGVSPVEPVHPGASVGEPSREASPPPQVTIDHQHGKLFSQARREVEKGETLSEQQGLLGQHGDPEEQFRH